MSAKTSTQPGRRTPLSLTGTGTKGQPLKGGNAPNSSGNNANGNSAANNNKQQQQQKTEQQTSVNHQKQQPAEKKHAQNDNKKQGSEKTQNGVNNKQQQQNKEKQHQNGNDGKLSEKDKKDKSEKQDKPEKEEPKAKEVKKDQDKVETKKEDKKEKEVVKEDQKEVKEDKKEVVKNEENKTDEKQENVKPAEKTLEETKSTDLTENKIVDEKHDEDAEKMEIQPEEEQQQQKSPPVTPKSISSRGSKSSTPLNKTPIKASVKTPSEYITPSKTIHIVTREVTTAIDVDIEMEPLTVEQSPIKSLQLGEVASINIAPSATSTPGKIIFPKLNTAAPKSKSDVQLAMLTGLTPERPKTFSHISGRKSIRPISEYTPSQFQSNSQFRESYRRINTELDATNTSLNVTVGSEVPNNSSFSFFGRGRKRDRTPPQHSQSAIGELQTDIEISPPKRARYDMQGFFNAVSSPLSLLRNRFSKATLQSSTPVKLEEKLMLAEDEIEVQNVSGVSIHEEINNTEKETENTTTNSEDDATLGVEAEETQAKKKDEVDVAPEKGELELEDKEFKDVSLKIEKSCAMESEQSDIKITETPLHPAVGDHMAKNKRCVVM